MTRLLDKHDYVSRAAFDLLRKEIAQAPASADDLVQLGGDLLRYNTLLSVARAGTGHLGASLSMADIVAELYFRRGQFTPLACASGCDPSLARASESRDIFVLSKGHAAPGHYPVLAALGYFPNQWLDRLRRWEGLSGHSHVTIPGVDANTGSLAMGMSKAVGFAIAKPRMKLAGHVYCLAGDGELQEGQAWEALLSAASFGVSNFTLIIDANKVQTDRFVDDILIYRDLPGSIRALGFDLVECDGHDASALRTALDRLDLGEHKPRCLYLHTIKGRGVSFMEHTAVLKKPTDRYVWHNRPPKDAELKQALGEIEHRAAATLARLDVELAETKSHQVPFEPVQSGIEGQPLIQGFSKGLVELGRKHKDVVVLDADLEDDCGLSPFRAKFPERFFELGIMEQHMCSAASAFAALGQVPVINSYAAFLTSRSNEQIYNLATDKNARFLIVGHLAGVIPATPGMSHQAFRDTSCLRSIPGLLLYQPMTADDCQAVLGRFGRGELGPMVYLRMNAAASALALPAADPRLAVGHSQVIRAGKDAVLISAGPVMLGESMAAADLLASEGIDVEVRNHPWLTKFADEMLAELAARDVPIVAAEDHHRLGGLGEGLWAAFARRGLAVKCGQVALEDLPDSGFRTEALQGMGVGRDAIVARIKQHCTQRQAA